MDPTRTTVLRNSFVADMNRRFGKLKKDVTELIVKDDVFGLDPSVPLTFNVNKEAWKFLTDSDKLKEYQKWLQGQIDLGILSTDPLNGEPWTSKYIDSAYRKGSIRAYTDVHKESLASSEDFYKGSKKQFLDSAFSQPERLSKVQFLFTRTFEELKGVTAAMSQQMSRVLAQGISNGLGPATIANNLRDTISGITKQRARTLARTEVIAAHAEGQLDSMQDLGVEKVGVMVEWSTAGDDRVCPQCEEMDTVVLKIQEARGLIPLHPNCRCAWIPANVGEKTNLSKATKTAKEDARDSAIAAGNPASRSLADSKARSTWAGKDKKFTSPNKTQTALGKKLAEPGTTLLPPLPTPPGVPSGTPKVKGTPKPKPKPPKKPVPEPVPEPSAENTLTAIKDLKKIPAEEVRYKHFPDNPGEEIELKEVGFKGASKAQGGAIPKDKSLWSEVELDLSKHDVYNVQPNVLRDGVEKKLLEGVLDDPQGLPQVFLHDGIYTLIDGNHRAVAQALLRGGKIRVEVVEKVKKGNKIIFKKVSKKPVPGPVPETVSFGESFSSVSYDKGLAPKGRIGKIQRQWADQMEEASERAPGLKVVLKNTKPNIHFMNATTVESGIDAPGVYSNGEIKIAMKKVTGYADLSTAKSIRKNTWIYDDSSVGTMRHEYGHSVKIAVERMAIKKKAGSWSSVADFSGRDARKFLGDYAKSTNSEMFAESFSAYTSPVYKKGTLPPRIEAWFEKVLE